MMNGLATQLLGYPTSGYIKVFTDPEGASLVEKNDMAFTTLLYAADPELWKPHLGAEGGLRRFLESGEPVPTASWISAEELDTHSRIIKGGYREVFAWYRAWLEMGPAEEDAAVPAEERKISVPTLLVIAEKDYAVIPDMHAHMTKEAAADLQVERLPVGHWIMLEATEELNKLLEGFVARVQG